MFDLIIIGAGPSGIFAAIQAKELNLNLKVLVLEKSSEVLSKLRVSGGGRCNITNATFDIKKLIQNYPRGQKELISAFYKFGPKDLINWLEENNVEIKIDESKKVFPKSNSSKTIVDLLLKKIKKNNIEIKLNQNIEDISKKDKIFEITLKNKEDLKNQTFLSKKIILATGSSLKSLKIIKKFGHNFDPFIPSLFSLKINQNNITKLKGLSLENVKVQVENSSFSNVGSILITHEGFSGPAIINLSSKAAIFLYSKNYKATLKINWLNDFSKEKVLKNLIDVKNKNLKNSSLKKTFFNEKIFPIPNNLWKHFLNYFGKVFYSPIQNIPNKSLIKLADILTQDKYEIISKNSFKKEFVSCGGVCLSEINFKDMQSKKCENLYIVGELLNIDGITGGFNLQNAFTTGFIAGNSI